MRRACWALVIMGTWFATTPARGAARSGADAAALAALERANATLRRFVLENGLVCLVKEDPSAPVVALQIWVGAGAVHEAEHLGGGLSHYLEHMIFKGTPTRKPGEIARQISDAGGQINAYTGWDRTVFHADLPARHWRLGLEVLADAVMNAAFPEEEWQREKEVILRELSMIRDNPDRELGQLLWGTAFVVHPYRVPVIGYKEIFATVTRDELLAFFHRHYGPDNMLVAVVGDIRAGEVEAALREIFGSFARRPRPPLVLPEEPPQQAPRYARQVRPLKVARLHMAYHTVRLTDPDAPALDLLAAIVGQGQSSRLVQRIKEEQKLVHSIEAWSLTPRYPGLFGISAAFDPDKESAVLAAIEAEVRSWAERPFARAEVEKVRRMMLVGELATLQTAHGQAASYASGELLAQDPRYAETYLRRLQTVTCAELRAVARRYLRPENRTLAVLSPVAEPAGGTNAVVPAPSAVQKLTLASGIPLLVREDHRLPFVYLCAALRGGVLEEREETSGLTRCLSEMLLRGTTSRTAREIAETVERLGAELNPFSGHNSFGLQARCLTADAETVLDVMFDCLVNPVFPPDELAKQKTVQLAAIDRQYEHPLFVAQQAAEEVLFPGHPYRWTPLGRRAAVEHFDQAALREHFRRLVVSGNLVLAVFGDLNPEQARQLAEQATRHVRRAAPPERPSFRAAPQLPARVEKREPKEQAIVLFGYPGVDLHDPRKDALEVLQTALSGLSAQLSEQIREQRGLAYYTGAAQRAGLEPGLFVVYAGTRPDAVPEVEGLVAGEIHRLVTTGLTDQEFQRARNQIIADHEMRLQDNMNLAMICALNELYGLGAEYEFTTRARFEALTAEQVRAAAAALLATNRQVVTLVLPAAAAAP